MMRNAPAADDAGRQQTRAAMIMAERYHEMAGQIRNATFALADRGSRP
jgi:hypothetical protein